MGLSVPMSNKVKNAAIQAIYNVGTARALSDGTETRATWTTRHRHRQVVVLGSAVPSRWTGLLLTGAQADNLHRFHRTSPWEVNRSGFRAHLNPLNVHRHHLVCAIAFLPQCTIQNSDFTPSSTTYKMSTRCATNST
jgi:hypothetical protein